MAFEGYSLYPPLTVRDNIAFALKSARMSAQEVAQVGGGGRARWSRSSRSSIAIPTRSRAASSSAPASRARWCVDADLYLLDEPMGQLEPQLRAVLRGRLKRLLGRPRA